MPADPLLRAGYALEFHRYLVRVASAAVDAFLWVFVFSYFMRIIDTPLYALVQTLLLYALVQVTAMLVMPLAQQAMRGNMLRGLAYGTLFGAIAFVYIGAFSTGSFPHGAAAIALVLGIHHAVYRIPYTMERGAFAPSFYTPFALELFLAAVPLSVGYLLTSSVSLTTLFFFAGALYIIALAPLLLVPHVYERYSWGYRETFHNLLDGRNRRLVFEGLIFGAGGAALFLLWPLAFFLVFTHSLRALGIVFSLTLLGILLFRSMRGRALAEQRADGGAYVDEYSVLKEMALALGRILVCLAVVVAASMY